jgi:ABC-type spermidine/putrescine transport system permease subunit I
LPAGRGAARRDQDFSLGHLATELAYPLYHITFQRSLTLALTTTLFCALLGFPVAYLFLIGGPGNRRIILVLHSVRRETARSAQTSGGRDKSGA